MPSPPVAYEPGAGRIGWGYISDLRRRIPKPKNYAPPLRASGANGLAPAEVWCEIRPSERVCSDDLPAVALKEFFVFVGVGQPAFRERLDEAASGGRGAEKQDATGFAAGVLPGVRYVARHECGAAGPAGGDFVADLEAELAGEHPGDLVTVAVQMIEARGAGGQGLLEHHDALAGLATEEFHCKGAAGCR